MGDVTSVVDTVCGIIDVAVGGIDRAKHAIGEHNHWPLIDPF
jgi:hypothetical protein